MTLHPQFEKDCIVLGKFELCHLLLMNDRQYPWCILVPDRDDIKEIYELSDKDQIQLSRESALLAAGMMKLFAGDKMNIAALGNVVAQLHIHHIVRFETDPAWPAPVWGKLPAQAYDQAALAAIIQQLRGQFTDNVEWSDAD